jgi:hemolysin activation/secretion protein
LSPSIATLLVALTASWSAQAQDTRSPVAARSKGSATQSGSPQRDAKAAAAVLVFDIDEYRVEGADALPQIEVEEAIYPFIGPKRTPEDVEKARSALEKSYHDKGFQAVSVVIPQQSPLNGVVTLKVTENKVGRVRVMGSRYFDIEPIKKRAASVAAGVMPDFNAVTKDIVALNQWPDRRVTPALRAGAAPGAVDIDLNVEDKLPFHGVAELNNRQSPNTTPLRANGTVHYDNLWQLGHSASFTYQAAPQRLSDAQVFAGSYLARIPDNDFASILLFGVTSSSNVATIGGLSVVGPGQLAGVSAIFTLPMRENFFHTASIGADYKHFGQTVLNGATGFDSPITYFPVITNYTAMWQGESSLTQLIAGATFGLRGVGSTPAAYQVRRDRSSANFIHFNGELSHQHELPEGFQIFGRAQGQYADQPLVSSEQMSLGGLDTVRGYLESEVLVDNGVAATAELRSPNLAAFLQALLTDEAGAPLKVKLFNEWRIYGFLDAAAGSINQPLPEQQTHFALWSYGVGTRVKLTDYFNGAVALAVPMKTQTYTNAKDPRVLFRVWGEF